jgi:hypothetical protein
LIYWGGGGCRTQHPTKQLTNLPRLQLPSQLEQFTERHPTPRITAICTTATPTGQVANRLIPGRSDSFGKTNRNYFTEEWQHRQVGAVGRWDCGTPVWDCRLLFHHLTVHKRHQQHINHSHDARQLCKDQAYSLILVADTLSIW